MENFANLDLLNAWILLLLFYLPFGEGKRGAATCFISVLDQDSDKNFRAWPRQNYSTVLNCTGWNYNVAVVVFHPISKMKRSKQNDIAKLWKYSLRTGGCYLNGGMGVVSKLIFALHVILKALVYPIIWSTLHKVPWVGFFACVFMMSFELPSCWKKLFALLCISNIILKIILSEIYNSYTQ